MAYSHSKDFLSSPKALFFSNNDEFSSEYREILLDTMKYFLVHPDEFKTTSPEYQFTFIKKCSLYHSTNPIYREVEEKLFTTEELKTIVNYLRETSGSLRLLAILQLSEVFLTPEWRIFLIDEIMDIFMEYKDFLLSHENLREKVQVLLTNFSEVYPHARYYYNLLFPLQNTKRYEATQEQLEGKYLRVG